MNARDFLASKAVFVLMNIIIWINHVNHMLYVFYCNLEYYKNSLIISWINPGMIIVSV